MTSARSSLPALHAVRKLCSHALFVSTCVWDTESAGSSGESQVSFALTLTAWHTSLSTPWLVCYTWDQAAGQSVINLHPLLKAALLVLSAADYLQVNRCGLTSQGLFCRCGRSLALAGRRDSGHITENKWTKGLQRGKRESQSRGLQCAPAFLTWPQKIQQSVFFIRAEQKHETECL